MQPNMTQWVPSNVTQWIPLPWHHIQKLVLTKRQLFERMGLSWTGDIDTALPQHWLNDFVDSHGLDYDQVLATTFWVYADSYVGTPISGCSEVNDALIASGFKSFEEIAEDITENAKNHN